MEQPLLHNEIGIQMSFNLLLYWSLVFLSAHCRRFGIWYAHKMIMVYLITAIVDPTICYADRGWTHFERSCSELIKPSKAGGNFFMWAMTIEISDKAGSQAGSKACNHCQSRGSKFGVLEINFPFWKLSSEISQATVTKRNNARISHLKPANERPQV